MVARSAFESSMRYRSAVLFGRCRQLDGQAKQDALDVLTDALIPGRVAEVRRPTGKELAATLVLRLTVEEFSSRSPRAGRTIRPSDVAGSAWAGVLPRRLSYPQAWPAPDLREGIELPGLGPPAARPD